MSTAAQIAEALGGRRIGSLDFMCRCPAHADKTPSLSVREGQNGVLVRCHAGCEQDAVIEALRERGLWETSRRREAASPSRRPAPPPPSSDDSKRIEAVQRLWRESHHPAGTLGEKYLYKRGLRLDEDLAGRVLRFHPACPWGERQRVPALLAAFRPINEIDDYAPPVALLRIGINRDGSKIAKKMLGPVAGCAIKLDSDEDVSMGLGIAEGIETAMAVRIAGWEPVWALGSAGAIRSFPVLGGVETLSIFADNDRVGLAAAIHCADRWNEAGREVEIISPRDVGADWLDEVTR